MQASICITNPCFETLLNVKMHLGTEDLLYYRQTGIAALWLARFHLVFGIELLNLTWSYSDSELQ